MALANKVTASSKVRLGTLLLRAGVVKPEEFAEALERSKSCDAPLGTLLVKAGSLRQEDLYAALYLQSLVGEGVLALETAIRAMRMCHTQGVAAAPALHALGWRPAIQIQLDEIEYLMTESGFVTKEVYEQTVHKTGSAFGLVLKSIIYCNQFNEILKAVSLVRVTACSLEQAKVVLTEYRKTGRPVEQLLAAAGIVVSRTNLRLGDLLVAASLLSEAEMLLALEKSLRTNKRLGQLITGNTRVTPEILDLCLQVQGLTATGVIAPETAVRIVRECTSQNIGLPEYLKRTKVLAEDPQRAAVLLSVLQMAGLVDDKDVRHALETTRDLDLGPIAALTVSKYIEHNIYQALWHCDELMSRGLLRFEQCVVAILWCQRTGGQAEEAVLHVTGQYTRLSDAAEDMRDELSHVQKLNIERAEIQHAIDKEKNSSHAALFILGLVAFIVSTCISAWLLPSSVVTYCLVAFSLAYAVYLGIIAWNRKTQIQLDEENMQLAATTAIRRNRK
jgi:hypothetical protein